MGIARKIAFINGKGGCGKTTSLFNIAGALSVKGHKVLAVDFDRQGNSTRTFLAGTGKEPAPARTIYDLLSSNFAGAQEAALPALFRAHGNAKPGHYGVDIIAGDSRMRGGLALNAADCMAAQENFNRFADDAGYGYVLYDMPPSDEGINRIVLGYMADYVLCPFSSDFYSVAGYSDILDTVKDARGTNPGIEVLGIFLSRYNARSAVDRYIREQLLKFDTFIDIQIPLASGIRESAIFGRPVSYYSKETASKRAFGALAGVIENKTGKARKRG